jgi:hypothetical protein
VQRLAGSGAATWSTGGVAVAAAMAGSLELVADGTGGACVAWPDTAGAARVLVQRIGADGSPLWTTGGLEMALPGDTASAPALASNDARGALVVWQVEHSGSGVDADIRAQRVDSSGVASWTAGGVAVSAASPWAQRSPAVVSDGAGGAIVAWMDSRDSGGAAGGPVAAWAQRLAATGALLWPVDGVRVEAPAAAAAPRAPDVLADGIGGAFVRGVSGLSRILPDGEAGWVSNFTPTLTGATDTPDDNGGRVRLAFRAPRAETEVLSPGIDRYEVWRKVGGAGTSGSGELRGPLSVQPSEWESVMAFAATGLGTYVVDVPTTSDSSSQGSVDETFLISAVVSGLAYLMPGNAMSAHSVDNLPPVPPANVEGLRVDEATVHLMWTPNVEPDLDHYNVFRGVDSTFVPSPASRVAQPAVSSYDDAAYTTDSTWYAVTAVDRVGNESAATRITPTWLLAAGMPAAPGVTFLGRFTPNPAYRGATIEYGLAHRGRVSVAVYDLSGRRVRSLVDGEAPAGVTLARWNLRDEGGARVGPGVYFVRMVAGPVRVTRKLVIGS